MEPGIKKMLMKVSTTYSTYSYPGGSVYSGGFEFVPGSNCLSVTAGVLRFNTLAYE